MTDVDRAERTYPLRSSRWAWVFLRPLVWRRPTVSVGSDVVAIHMGWLGGARIPLGAIDRISRMHWPWWGGVGARLGRHLVAFVAGPGEAAVIELQEPIKVRAPLPWSTARIIVAPENLDAFIADVADARRDVWIRPTRD